MTDNPPDPATTIVLVHGFWMTRHASSLPPPDRQRQRAIYRERRARGALARSSGTSRRRSCVSRCVPPRDRGPFTTRPLGNGLTHGQFARSPSSEEGSCYGGV
jgi:hypothetical protein